MCAAFLSCEIKLDITPDKHNDSLYARERERYLRVTGIAVVFDIGRGIRRRRDRNEKRIKIIARDAACCTRTRISSV